VLIDNELARGGDLRRRQAKVEVMKELCPKLTFEIGNRVRLSARGRVMFRHTPERRGTIKAISKTGMAFRVKWDSAKEADYVHGSLLERDKQT